MSSTKSLPLGQAALAACVVLQAGLVGFLLVATFLPRASSEAAADYLPRPSAVSVPAFEEKLFAFLNAREYVRLGWKSDKSVRDTGPFLNGVSHGTHPAVRVYYSPGVIRWLEGGRAGAIPDGEMIIKEQYAAPAARHEGKSDEQLWRSLESWTVMVKDSAGSHDGWFWSNPVKGQCVVDNHAYPYNHPVSGFGHYCVRCHASTASPKAEAADRGNEFTFAALRNIKGYPGEPILFRVDDSWRKDKAAPSAGDAHPTCARPEAVPVPKRSTDRGFLDLFASVKPTALADVHHLPPQTHDWVVHQRGKGQGFVTANQCMGCHAGLTAPYGPSMFVPEKPHAPYGDGGRDVSPHGEWRWTPMGLAGRDPIFHAQLAAELASIPHEFPKDPALVSELRATLTDTCLRCHGAMGHAAHAADHGGKEKFALNHLHAVAGKKEHIGTGESKYGALARDGVSCAVCHRMQPRPKPAEDTRPYLQHFLETSITGRYHLGKPGEINGPYKDAEISPYVMEHGTGLKPRHDPFIKSSQLCGSCHAVVLPNIDRPLGKPGEAHGPDELTRAESTPLFRKFHHHVEQATYLEWLNSEYENEVETTNPKAKTCQDCHMASTVGGKPVRTRIAAVQDTTYPDAENLAPHEKLKIRIREDGYRRHNFAGLNAFLLTMFDQCDDVLGVAKEDFMTGSKAGIKHALDDIARTAQQDTADVGVKAALAGRTLTANVVVANKAGHRFPSGVGFRRAFVHLVVVEKSSGKTLWESGRTNEYGVILGADGKPLPSEFFDRDPETKAQRYQAHHEVITSPDQVQVYETLLKNARGEFTTSFVRGCERVKDNRLLPRGWKKSGPGGGLTGRYLEATHPDEVALADPRYADGSGTDEVTYRVTLPEGTAAGEVEVRAALYYQAIPPYFLRALFETAPDAPAVKRLHHLCAHLDLKGTPIEGWKLKVGAATCGVTAR